MMLSDNMLSDYKIAHGWKNKLYDNMLSDNIMASDKMLSYFLSDNNVVR
jgi:hypothetical protein